MKVKTKGFGKDKKIIKKKKDLLGPDSGTARTGQYGGDNGCHAGNCKK